MLNIWKVLLTKRIKKYHFLLRDIKPQQDMSCVGSPGKFLISPPLAQEEQRKALLKLWGDLIQGYKLLWQALHCFLLAGVRKGHFAPLGQDVGLVSALGSTDSIYNFLPAIRSLPLPLLFTTMAWTSVRAHSYWFVKLKANRPSWRLLYTRKRDRDFPSLSYVWEMYPTLYISFVGTCGKSEPLTLTLVT